MYIFFIASSLSISQSVLFGEILSYVSYYPTLGHYPILEFIRSFAYFLTAWSISWSLWVVILGHTPLAFFYWGIPPSWCLSGLLRIVSLLDLFLDLYGSSHWGIPPSLSLSDLLRTFSLFDLFLDLCESSYRGIPPLALFYWGIPPLFGFTVSHVDFMVVRLICRSLWVIT